MFVDFVEIVGYRAILQGKWKLFPSPIVFEARDCDLFVCATLLIPARGHKEKQENSD